MESESRKALSNPEYKDKVRSFVAQAFTTLAEDQREEKQQK